MILCKSILLHVLHSHQLAEKELKAHQLQQKLTHEQAVSKENEPKAHQLQQELTHEQALTREKESEVHELQQQVSAIV